MSMTEDYVPRSVGELTEALQDVANDALAAAIGVTRTIQILTAARQAATQAATAADLDAAISAMVIARANLIRTADMCGC